MNPEQLAALYTGSNGLDEARSYLQQAGLLSALEMARQAIAQAVPPDYRDLARLHRIVRERRCLSVLEFGAGYSSWVMAAALADNQSDWDSLTQQPPIRCHTPFQLHSLDGSQQWSSLAASRLPETLAERAQFHVSEIISGVFQGRDCHYYQNLPSVVPDLIYLDAPDPTQIDAGQASPWHNPDRLPLAADILRAESWLLPGTLVVVDGRTANARFLQAHFYRRWQVVHNRDAEVTVMELQEPALGAVGEQRLLWCVGNRSQNW